MVAVRSHQPLPATARVLVTRRISGSCWHGQIYIYIYKDERVFEGYVDYTRLSGVVKSRKLFVHVTTGVEKVGTCFTCVLLFVFGLIWPVFSFLFIIDPLFTFSVNLLLFIIMRWGLGDQSEDWMLIVFQARSHTLVMDSLNHIYCKC